MQCGSIDTIYVHCHVELHLWMSMHVELPPVDFLAVDQWAKLRACIHAYTTVYPRSSLFALYILTQKGANCSSVLCSGTYICMIVNASLWWIRCPSLSVYSRERIKVFLQHRASIAEIVDTLKCEGTVTCRQRFQHHLNMPSILLPPKLGLRTKLTATSAAAKV